MDSNWIGIAEDLTQNGVIGTPFQHSIPDDAKDSTQPRAAGKHTGLIFVLGFAAVMFMTIKQIISTPRPHALAPAPESRPAQESRPPPESRAVSTAALSPSQPEPVAKSAMPQPITETAIENAPKQAITHSTTKVEPPQPIAKEVTQHPKSAPIKDNAKQKQALRSGKTSSESEAPSSNRAFTSSSTNELTLFDVSLSAASRQEIRSAVTAAGGKLKTSSADADRYDVKAIGLPGALHLEIVYFENQLVTATYQLSNNDTQEMRVRKMLMSKYGKPQKTSGMKRFGEDGSEFDSEYISFGDYTWSFQNSMQLIFKKDFFSSAPRYICYVNTNQKNKLNQQLKDTDNRAAKKEAESKNNVF